MNQNKVIKVLAIANLVSLPVVIALGLVLESDLPSLLVRFLEQEMERDNTNMELAVTFITIPVLLAHIASLIGVLFNKLWSRSILLYSSVLLFLLTPFLGPYVDHGISATLDSLTSLLLGALLSLLFFGQSSFNKASQQDAASGAAA